MCLHIVTCLSLSDIRCCHEFVNRVHRKSTAYIHQILSRYNIESDTLDSCIGNLKPQDRVRTDSVLDTLQASCQAAYRLQYHLIGHHVFWHESVHIPCRSVPLTHFAFKYMASNLLREVVDATSFIYHVRVIYIRRLLTLVSNDTIRSYLQPFIPQPINRRTLFMRVLMYCSCTIRLSTVSPYLRSVLFHAPSPNPSPEIKKKQSKLCSKKATIIN